MRVVICGAGQVGTTIARHLASEGLNVTVIDSDPEQVRRVDESHDVRGVLGHASHPETLRKAGVQDADIFIAVTRSDEVNMVACQVAYSLFGAKRRIARLRHSGYLAQDKSGLYAAEHLPIDVIISPEIEIAQGIARRLATPGAFDMMPLAGNRVELLGIRVEDPHAPVVKERIAELKGNEQLSGMAVLAVVRKGRCFIPDPQDRIAVGDDVYVLAKKGQVNEIMTAFGHRERVGRKLIVVGAGNVGLNLVKTLRHRAPLVDIKLIEQDKERAESAAAKLGSSVIVLRGDALEREVLDEAQAALTETIVAVTNDDETNIFASVLAKQAGCKRTITLVNKRSYETVIPVLGLNSVVSPSAVTISTVLQHVRHTSINALYTIREDFGEVIEAHILADSRLLRRPLNQLGLPVGLKIGAVIRDGEVIFPEPDLHLHQDDVVIALVAYSSLKLAEALLGSGRIRGN